MTRSFYTLNSVAETVNTDLQEYSTHKLPIYLKWAMEVYREMVFDFAREIKTVKLDLNSYRALDWPDDYVDWVKVGVQYGDKIYTLGTADNIALYHDKTDCDSLILNTPTSVGDGLGNGVSIGNYLSSYTFWNYGGSNITGHGGIAHKGYFRVNKTARQLQFASSFPASPIYLEYISDGISPCGTTYLDPLMYDACRQGTHYRRIEFDPNISLGEKQIQGRKAHEAMKKAMYRKMDINVNDIINSSRGGYILTNHI